MKEIEKFYVDLANSSIIIKEDVEQVDVRKDLYMRIKALWHDDEECIKYYFPIEIQGFPPHPAQVEIKAEWSYYTNNKNVKYFGLIIETKTGKVYQ